nr:GH32 C-terminal domain-containing protein [Streptomyces sp. TLI_235]
MLSLPRELELGADGDLRQRPARGIDELRGTKRIGATGAAFDGEAVDLGGIGRAADLVVRLECSGGLQLVTSAAGDEYLAVVRDPDTGDVVVDRRRASLDPRAKGGSWRLPAPQEGPVELRIVLDHSVAEVFTSAGESLTVRFYPVGDAPWRLRATAQGAGAAVPYAVEAWDLAGLAIKDKRPTAEDTP